MHEHRAREALGRVAEHGVELIELAVHHDAKGLKGLGRGVDARAEMTSLARRHGLGEGALCKGGMPMCTPLMATLVKGHLA